MRDRHIPDLTISCVEFGSRETPWDLRCLLYRGGSAAHAKRVATLLDEGKLGAPLLERITLVDKIHQEISGAQVSGGSKETARTVVELIRRFFAWADKSETELSLGTVDAAYREWADHLLHRIRIKKDLSEQTAYQWVAVIGVLLDRVLGRGTPLVVTTRIRPPRRKIRVRGIQCDKQDLAATFKFGHMLVDIANSLSKESVTGPLPVAIAFADGTVVEHWAGWSGNLKRVRRPPRTADEASKARYAERQKQKRREAWSLDTSIKARASLINLRIEAELLIFIAQTGMNRSQVFGLRLRQFSYKSTTDGFEVRDYKERRAGQVLFEIYSEYRKHFKAYLDWRNSIFPLDGNGLLFPFVRQARLEGSSKHEFLPTKELSNKQGIAFISPSILRNTRVNWLLRRSGDPELTAEMAQHGKETLLQVYERPSLQRAADEITRFWSSHDPSLPAVAPGACPQRPERHSGAPAVAPPPDCVDPSGCLWCVNHHDLDTPDYVWSLASMRHLKHIAQSRYGDAYERLGGAVRVAIDRLNQKLRWFEDSNAIRRQWVVDALERVDGSIYHPHWGHLIEAFEGTPHEAG